MDGIRITADVMGLLELSITRAVAWMPADDDEKIAVADIAKGVASVFEALYWSIDAEAQSRFISDLLAYAAHDDPELNTLRILAGHYEYDLGNLGDDDIGAFLSSFVFLRILFYGERRLESGLDEMDLPDLDG